MKPSAIIAGQTKRTAPDSVRESFPVILCGNNNNTPIFLKIDGNFPELSQDFLLMNISYDSNYFDYDYLTHIIKSLWSVSLFWMKLIGVEKEVEKRRVSHLRCERSIKNNFKYPAIFFKAAIKSLTRTARLL